MLHRATLVAAGSLLLTLLAVAASLRPDSRGFGTHQRLGLPPCSFMEFTGIRCPSCGMTTSWAYMVRVQPLAAFRANTGGALLAVVSMLLAPWAVASGAAGRWLVWCPGQAASMYLVVSLLLITFIDWSVRLLW